MRRHPMLNELPDLPTFDAAPLQMVFPQGGADASRHAGKALPSERTLRRRGRRRSMLDYRRVPNAARALERLPAAGETLHVVMAGNFDGWDIVPAVLRLAAPATVAKLHVATLGFNERGIASLVQLLDGGQIAAADFVTSCYFRSVDALLFAELHAALTTRGGRCVAVRSHAKLLLFALTDGRKLTVESSANLRSCHNIEQCAITNDARLHAFHAGWVDDVIAATLSREPRA